MVALTRDATPAAVLDRLIVPTSDAARLAADYVEGLGATLVGQTSLEPEIRNVLGVGGGDGIRCELSFGGRRVDLVEVRGSRPYPCDSTATDLWFQHFALVVDDIARAYAAVRETKAFLPLSRTGPVRLPPSSGAVTAVKFRDFDGHPLELLQAGDESPIGRETLHAPSSSTPVLDHTAMSVANTTATVRFFQQVLGFWPTASTYNVGPEQSALDDVAEASARVTKLQGATPGVALELLDYDTGPRRPVPATAAAHDIAATHTVFGVASIDGILGRLAEHQGPAGCVSLVQAPCGRRVAVLTDPDHHRLVLEEIG